MESFDRPGEDPRALTSEGHLDSLGLCIFLAFVKKFNDVCNLVVLDDVVSTIDATHRGNICKLLFKEFNDRQLIITTHDMVWYEQLCASQRTYGMEGDFKNFEIIGWSVDEGPKIRPFKPRWEKIQDKVKSGDKQGAGNGGRQYLEWALEEICINTETPVPITSFRRLDVGTLLPAAKKRLGKLIKEKENAFAKNIAIAFTNLEETTIFGNILSHNNIMADKVSKAEVEKFCNCVHDLHESFSCPNCGHLIKYFRELKILRCSNGNCKKPLEVDTK